MCVDFYFLSKLYTKMLRPQVLLMFGLLFSKDWNKLSGRMQSGQVCVELDHYKDTHIHQAIGTVSITSASPMKVSAPPACPFTPASVAEIHFSNPRGKYRCSKLLLPFGNLAGRRLCVCCHIPLGFYDCAHGLCEGFT